MHNWIQCIILCHQYSFFISQKKIFFSILSLFQLSSFHMVSKLDTGCGIFHPFSDLTISEKKKIPTFLIIWANFLGKTLIGMTWVWWISMTQSLWPGNSTLIGQAGLCVYYWVRKAGEVIDSSSGFGTGTIKERERKRRNRLTWTFALMVIAMTFARKRAMQGIW